MSRRGFAGFGGRHGFPGGPSGAGFGGLNRGRKLGSADLQLLLLALLAERPSHGYELIKALDERSNGYYAPSPGTVYPALTYLEEIGHASVEAQGAKKRYSITETGLTHLEGQRASVDALLEQLAYIGKRMDEVRRAMGSGDAPNDAADFDSPQAFGGRGRHAAGSPADNSEHVISYWMMFQKFHSPALGGFAVLSHWLPFLAFSVPVGALADRTGPRRIIQCGMLLFIIASLGWGWFFVTDSLQMWQACVLLVIHGLPASFGRPRPSCCCTTSCPQPNCRVRCG